MCITWCPPISAKQRQEIRSQLSQPRVHETASISNGQVHFLPASPELPLTLDEESGNFPLKPSTIIQFPSTHFYLCPKRDILLIDELETLYEWDGIFAHYVPATGWRDFCELLTVMALDPFYDPSGQRMPLSESMIETDAWMNIVENLAGYLFDNIERLPKLEEIILLSSDEWSTGFLVHVEEYMKKIAFRNWLKSMEQKAVEYSNDCYERANEEVEIEKVWMCGWKHCVPKITILAYEYRDGDDQMLAMKKALLT
ncbi:hypothetical protein V8E51_008900 [Hyaloscypha variabilis]